MKLDNKFIGKCFVTSIRIPSDSDYHDVKIYSKNTIFFYNLIIELISYESNYGTRFKVNSLLSVINSEIEYFEDITKMNSVSEKNKTIPEDRRKYLFNKIKNNKILNDKKYKSLFNRINNSNDLDYISILKMLKLSLEKDNKYFNEISDHLYELLLLQKNDMEIYEQISIYTNEYVSLLIEFGLSIKCIRDIFKDCLRKAIENKNQGNLLKFFELFGDTIKNKKDFIVVVKMEKEYDEFLIKALKLGQNKQFKILSKKGVINLFSIASNENKLKSIIEKIEKDNSNPCYLKYEVKAFDKWQAINQFKYNCLQPYLGSLIYSGIYDDMKDEKFTVVSIQNKKYYVDEYKNNEDVFSPINQSKIDYSELYKRYIIRTQENQIRLLVDEVVSLLPTYSASTNSLSRFSNTWFALEFLYKNACDKIIDSLYEYAVPIITDRSISGYLYIGGIQYLILRKGKISYGSNKVESIFEEMFNNPSVDSEYILWKINRINKIIDNYSNYFDDIQLDVKYHISNIYHIRNKQFHGTKGINLDYSTGYIYDIVNETLGFLMDYMDVYKKQKCNLSELYSTMKMIKNIKMVLLDGIHENSKRAGILIDSVRQI